MLVETEFSVFHLCRAIYHQKCGNIPKFYPEVNSTLLRKLEFAEANLRLEERWVCVTLQKFKNVEILSNGTSFCSRLHNFLPLISRLKQLILNVTLLFNADYYFVIHAKAGFLYEKQTNKQKKTKTVSSNIFIKSKPITISPILLKFCRIKCKTL